MNTSVKSLLAIVAISLPTASFAQSTDAAYCKVLVSKYEQYLDMSSKRGQQPQSLESRVALQKCQAGDPAGIPGMEKALQDAGYAIPSPKATTSAPPAKSANCGVETWSTEKMAYVSTPCTSP